MHTPRSPSGPRYVSSPELFRKELPDRVRRTEECANAPPEDAGQRARAHIEMKMEGNIEPANAVLAGLVGVPHAMC